MTLAAVLENFVPPFPADMLIRFGGLVIGHAGAPICLAALVVWLGKVAGALAVYGLGRPYGPQFLSGLWGRVLLRPRQLVSLTAFYRRYGIGVIFVSRFLPFVRAVVPVSTT